MSLFFLLEMSFKTCIFLSGTHSLLRKLQFLFELPAKLKTCITEGNYAQGVAFYLRAQRVLDQVLILLFLFEKYFSFLWTFLVHRTSKAEIAFEHYQKVGKSNTYL
jgi:hypothetical protein